MTEWKKYRLGDIAEVQTGPFGSQLHMSDYKEIGTPIITVEHLGENKIVHSNLPLVGIEDKQRLIKYTLKEGDIVFSRVGSVDRRAYISKAEDGWMFSGRCLRVRADQKNVNPKFLSFYFGQESFKETIRRFAVGATMPSINTTLLCGVDISIPELKYQNAIAEVLSSLDDKIDLLHLQNKTLEQLAETLFRQWFVEEAEEGCEEVTFGDLVTPKKGKNITKSQAIEGEYPVVAGGLEPSCYHNEANTKSPVITVSSSGANAGFVRLYYTQVWSSDSCYIDETVTPYVYFSYVFLREKQRQLTDKQEGSAQPHIYPIHIMELDMLNYPKELIEKFEKEATPIFQRIKSNTHQIRTLTQLRDTLLPKLMSGEVRVKSVKGDSL